MKKFFLLSTAALSLFAGSIEYGAGSFHIKYGLYEKTLSSSTDVTSYSLVERHKNIFSSSYYYRYNITWLKIDRFNTPQNSVTTALTPYIAPAMEYEPEGLDVTVGLGRDVIKEDERDYLGIGLDVGLSIPTVDSSQKSSGSSFNLGNFDIDVVTYKVGPHITFSKSFNKTLSFYGSANWAFQKFHFEANRFQSSVDVNGKTYGFDIGLRADFLHKNYKIGFIHLSPRLYAVAGYRYQKWDVEDFEVDLVGFSIAQQIRDLQFRTNYGYFGIGYSF